YYLGVGWDALAKFHIDAEMKGVGGLYVADDVAHQNYALINLKFTYQALRMLDLFVNLDNVTDTEYTINRGYEMPGFTAMAGFRLSL
ncbi:MAG: TonB-dependent receptor, partial [Duncaniella sp.]|nr:TonB-dependent receptor [Duncaniella sp.]